VPYLTSSRAFSWRPLDRDGKLSGSGNDAQLDKHAELIGKAPVLDELAVCDAPDVDLAPGRSRAGGRHAEEVANCLKPSRVGAMPGCA